MIIERVCSGQSFTSATAQMAGGVGRTGTDEDSALPYAVIDFFMLKA